MVISDIKINDIIIEDKSLYEVYIDYQTKAEEIYGEKTIVLYQVGDFYEIYGYDLPDRVKIDHLRNILKIIHYTETSKNKSIEHSIKNPKMTGFPIGNVKRNIELLLNYNYTIINISQIGNSVEFNKNKVRKVVDIISPSTYIYSEKTSNILLAIYLEDYNDNLYGALSYCDIIQGINTIYEIKDNENIEDIIYKNIKILEPKEIIIVNNLKNINIENKLIDLDIINYKYRIIDCNLHYNKIEYQEHILSKIFKNNTNLNIFEYLDIELLSNGRLIYIYLLIFLQEHNISILNNINKPKIYKPDKYILLDRETIYRLNLIYNNNNEVKYSLLNILDKTISVIGKREFRNRLLQPIINTYELERRYKLIDYFINNNNILIKTYLEGIYDIQKLHRKIHISEFSNLDINKLYLSYNNIIKLYKLLYISNTTTILNLIKFKEIDILEELVIYIEHNINLNVIDSSIIFNTNIHTDLDILLIELDEYKNIYYIIQKELSKYIEIESNSNKKKKKIIDNDKEINYITLEYKNNINILYLTDTKAKLLETYINKNKNKYIENNIISIKLSDIKIIKSTKKNKYNIVIEQIIDTNNKINDINYKYNELLCRYYKEFLEYIYINYISKLNHIVNLIEEIDISYCNANNAIRYNYTCPLIIDNAKSYLKVENIRHPIIEQINKNIQYVSNNVELGINNNDGLLIYGINSSGKSSLMKSIGLCIIMAQSGMYVSAHKLEYCPYKSIFTRIGTQDNIFTSRSSFTQEMYELRNIFNYANENSLIIGDEICNGTEECSALSLVASTIKILSTKKSSFIFATHLHKLIELELINNIDNLNIKHLKITIKNGLIIYNRKLDNGNGSQEYGIMVAQSLNMPDDFITYANNTRNIIKNDDNIFNAKNNRYNSSKFSSTCEICNLKYDEIHHINFQRDANKFNYSNDVYIHDNYNLVSLCSSCHDKIHNNEIIINGYIQTSNGSKLDYYII